MFTPVLFFLIKRSLPLSPPATVWLSADKDSLSHVPPTALNEITPLTSVYSGTAARCVVDFQAFGSTCNQVASQFVQMQLSFFVLRHLTLSLSMFFCHAPLSPHLPFSFYHLRNHQLPTCQSHTPATNLTITPLFARLWSQFSFVSVFVCFLLPAFKVYFWLLSAFESHLTCDSFGVGPDF